MALTAKSKAFAQAIVDGMSNRDAAIYAGYSVKTASQQGTMLAKNPEVAARINDLKQKREKVEQLKAKSDTLKEIKKHKCTDPMDKLLEFMNSGDPEVELEAAKVLMPYIHGKVAPIGKKEGEAKEAKQATTSGKFATFSKQPVTTATTVQ